MAQIDQEKWDSKYAKQLGRLEPSELVENYYSSAPQGEALDIACGTGRNSMFLGNHGFSVDAVDISTIATDHLAKNNSKINVLCHDLDTWKFPRNKYELIVNIHFLERRLFPMIIDGLKPGGLLIFESFMSENKDRFCLKPNELLDAFSSCRIVYYEEKETGNSDRFDHIARLVAIKQR